MSDLKVSRWMGAFGLATVVLWLSQFPLYMVGNPPSVYDGLATSRHLSAISTIAFTRILLDQGVCVSMMVFAAGFRHLIRQARQDYEWIGTLLFGTAIVWLAVTLVADDLAGGAVLDAISSQPGYWHHVRHRRERAFGPPASKSAVVETRRLQAKVYGFGGGSVLPVGASIPL